MVSEKARKLEVVGIARDVEISSTGLDRTLTFTSRMLST
jgi:hypothetical protein